MTSIEKLLDLNIEGIDEPKESTVDIALSKLGGQKFTFPIVELDNETRANILDSSFSVRNDEEGKPDVRTHSYAAIKIAILAGCPIFKDKRYRDKFKARTGEQLIDKMLDLSEATQLSEAIQALSDVSSTELLSNLGELKDEVKN